MFEEKYKSCSACSVFGCRFGNQTGHIRTHMSSNGTLSICKKSLAESPKVKSQWEAAKRLAKKLGLI